MQRICRNCQRGFREGDHVRASILTVYHELKSKTVYALDKPYECEDLEHINCQYPSAEFGVLDDSN